MTSGPPPTLQAQWFDGRSPQPQEVHLSIEDDTLVVRTEAQTRRYPCRQLRWPEPMRHGQRQMDLPDGSSLQHPSAAQWDQWLALSGRRTRPIARWQQSWRATVGALLGCVLFLGAAWFWGVPALSRTLVQWVPASLEAQLGDTALQQIQTLFLQPSQLPADQQQAIHKQFAHLVAGAFPQGDAPAWQLHHFAAPKLGPNALALPGGHIILTDELVHLLADSPDALQGVLAHELGHVAHQDGLNMMVRSSLVSVLVGVVLGDASGFITALPATLVTQGYSRDMEHAADGYAAAFLHANAIPPAAMAVFFERISASQGQTDGHDRGHDKGHEDKDRKDKDESDGLLPIAISSHPDHAERIAFFKHWKPQSR